MSRFHISDGRVMPCKAKEGECPLGGEHYSSRDEADIVAERINIEKYGLLGVDNQTKDQARLDGRYDRLEELSDRIGVENTLNSLARALTKKDLEESIDYISRSHIDNNKDLEFINSSNDRFDRLNFLIETLGEEEVLDSLAQATQAHELSSKLDLIARDNDYVFHEDRYYDRDSLFNTDNYIYEDDYHYVKDELNYLLEEKAVKPRGEIMGYALKVERTSHYGAIGGAGKTGYSELRSGSDLAGGLLGVATDTMKINEVDGLLIATFHDHDGIHHGEIKPIAKSRYETFKDKLEYGGHEEILEYLDTVPSIKAKKRK